MGRKNKQQVNPIDQGKADFAEETLVPFHTGMGHYDPEVMGGRRDDAEKAVDPRDYGEFSGKFGQGDYSYGSWEDPGQFEAEEFKAGDPFDFGKEFSFNWDGDKSKLLQDQETNFFDSSLVGTGGSLNPAFQTANTDLADKVGGQIADYTAGTGAWAEGDKKFLDKQRQHSADDRDRFLGGRAGDLAGSGLLSSSAMVRAGADAMKGYDRQNDEMAFGLYQGNKGQWGDMAAQDKGAAMNLLGMGQEDYQQGIRNRMEQYYGDRDFARGTFQDDRDFAAGRHDTEEDRRRRYYENTRDFDANNFRDHRDFTRGVFEDDRGFARGIFESDRGYHQSGLDRWLAAQEEAKKRKQENYNTDSDRAGQPYG